MKQNLTISLDRKTIRKAKIVAARRDTSISGLVTQQLEILVGEEEAYERAERQAVALLDEGFHLAAACLSAGKNCMNGRTFVDTNILIYAHDLDAKSKHAVAGNILRELWSERTGVLSMQVLQEFYVNVTRKIRSPLPKDSARLVVSSYSIWCVETTPAELSVAFRIEDESQIGFWDALIVSAAAKSGATRLLSEDLNPGQKIAGLRIENPFAAAP